jgi:hypothetical protein
VSSPRSLTIDGFVAVSAGADFRAVPDLTGWGDSPEIRSEMANRSQQDGAWDSTGFFGKRVVGIDGFVEAASHDAAIAIRDELTALRPQTVHTLTVDDGYESSAVVRVTQGAVFHWLNDVTFKYTLQLTAPDALRYGPAVFLSTGLDGVAGTGRVWPRAWPRDWGVPAGSTAGSLAVPNAGKAAYWPRLRIDGPVPNPVVTVNETGDTLRYAGTLLAGQYLDIDCGSRRVLLNGQVSMAPLVTWSGSALAIPEGGASVSWNADAADPAATLSVFAYEGAWQ